jgi:hypothetical protein
MRTTSGGRGRLTGRNHPDSVQLAARPLGDVLDDLDKLVDVVALLAGEVDEIPRPLNYGAAFGCPCDRDAAPAPEFEQSLVT